MENSLDRIAVRVLGSAPWFNVLSDVTRLRVVELLVQRERWVCDLKAAIGLTQTREIGPTLAIEKDTSRASEVEVRFTEEAPGRTRIDLVHRHLDRHGAGWEGLRDSVQGPGGWPLYLDRFAAQT